MNNSNIDNKFTLTNIGVWVLVAGILVMSVYFFLAGEEDIATTLMPFVYVSSGISTVGIILILIGRFKDKRAEGNNKTKNGLFINDSNSQKKDKK